MSDAVREQLLGYLLGALDKAEQQAVEQRLPDNPQLQRDLIVLSKALEPLDATRQEFTPPPDLAARTCRAVFAESPRPAGRAWPTSLRPMSRQVEPLRRRSRLRWQDVVAAAALLIAATMLLFPGLQNSREQSRLLACQSNLGQIGRGLAEYSQLNRGYFPVVPPKGNLAAAGMYAPTLLQGGFLTDSSSFVCPASPLAEERQFRIPTMADIQAADGSGQLRALRQSMGGSYGYCLGHMDNGVYKGTKNLGRAQFALMSDAPSFGLPDRRSLNHGAEGQNVLFESGRVQFVRGTKLPEGTDDFFVNDDGLVAAGTHQDDAVIAASSSRPILRVRIWIRKAPLENLPVLPMESKKTETPTGQPDATDR